MGYMCEVSANWVSAYFRGDPMRLPSSPEEAFAEAERASAWMRHRYPNMISWINESYSTGLDFWTYVSFGLLNFTQVKYDHIAGHRRPMNFWKICLFRAIGVAETGLHGLSALLISVK